jgi:ribulose-phosphate 3-epimerase
MQKPLIAPSLLAADFYNLKEAVELVNHSDADWFHLDVMDGAFVPNITFGQFIIDAIAKHALKPLDVHLMIQRPELFVQEFAAVGADIITVHYEACTHLHRQIQQIKNLNKKAGVALNPHTPVHLLKDILKDLDLVCIMSVNPGFGGQKFINNTFEKLTSLRQMAIDLNHEALMIEIDGGVDISNAAALIGAGADVLVAGSAVFKAENPVDMIKRLKNASSENA